MARDQVEEIKSKVDIVEVVGERVKLVKAGRHFKGLCPFHSEKSPSFIVSPERQSYKCFGCSEGGDVFSFLEKYEGYSFLEALEFLAAKTGVTLESYKPSASDERRRRILEILKLAGEYYHYLLTKHEGGGQAREYLKNRRIANESIKLFYLGYAPNQWRSVSDYLLFKKGYTKEELEEAGLIVRVKEDKYYDRFRGRVMFPLRDHKGVIVGFSGRTIQKETKEAKYINSPETSVYHKSQMLYGLYENRAAIRQEDKIILVEGELDVIPSVQAGVLPTVAIKGSAFSVEQAQIISRYSRNIYMSLDADQAGEEAIKRAVKIAESMDLSIRVVQIVGGKDPGEVASENGRKWRELIEKAVLYWDFLIESSLGRNDPGSGTGAEKITREVVPTLALVANKVVQAHYIKKLATKLAVSEEVIYQEMNRIQKKKDLSNLRGVVKTIEQGSHSRSEELSLYILSLALQNYKKLRAKIDELKLEWITHPAGLKILRALQQLEKKELEIQEFAKSMPPELMPTLDQAYLRDLSRISLVEREWEMAVHEIEEVYVREKLKDITSKLTEIDGGDEHSTQILKNDFGQYSRRLAELTK